QFDLALAMLWEVHQRNAQRPNLEKALGMATDELIKRYEAKGDYRTVRRLLQRLAARFPDQSVVTARSDDFRRKASELLDEARAAMQNGDLREAARLTRQQQYIWPNLRGAKELAESLHRRHSRVVVGVCMRTVDTMPGRLSDRAARRSSRLLYRTLAEFVGPGVEGGRYDCPVGTMNIEAMERRLSIEIRSEVRWSSGESTLTVYDVSRRLIAMADLGDSAYRVDWAELLAGLTVGNVNRVDVQLQRAHVRPDALLQTILLPYTTPGSTSETTLSNGPYVAVSRSDDETVYLPNPQYFAAEEGQPVEIVERHYREGAEAIRALKRGHIHLLARVNPWGLDVVREDADLVIAPYGVPLVHCLIPNMRKPLTSRRTFRRALVYGINRKAILDQLTGGAEL
ncbi:hypothetical protein LCGC14_2844640, partial [marine sediment metagenome]